MQVIEELFGIEEILTTGVSFNRKQDIVHRLVEIYYHSYDGSVVQLMAQGILYYC